MKIKKTFAFIFIVLTLTLCSLTVFNAAAADYAEGSEPPNGEEVVGNAENIAPFTEDELVDIEATETPLGVAAPATGIDQRDLAMQRAVDVVIFGLSLSLASVIAVKTIKKLGNKTK